MNTVSDTDEFLSDSDGTQQTGGGLRVQLERALAELKTLKVENEKLSTRETERELAKVWDELKVPSAIRGFYTGDKSEKAIKEWWEASRGFFNTEAGEQPAEERESEQDRAQRDLHQQFQQAAALGSDKPAGMGDLISEAERIKGLTGADQKAALKALYEKAGVPPF